MKTELSHISSSAFRPISASVYTSVLDPDVYDTISDDELP